MGMDVQGTASLSATIDEIEDRWTGTFHFETGTGVEYAAYMEFGTPRHDITPDTKKALSFTVNGVDVVTTFVDHPGTKPRPYMQPAAEGAARRIAPIVATNNDLEGVTEALAEEVEKIASRIAPRRTGRLAASITVRRVS